MPLAHILSHSLFTFFIRRNWIFSFASNTIPNWCFLHLLAIILVTWQSPAISLRLKYSKPNRTNRSKTRIEYVDALRNPITFTFHSIVFFLNLKRPCTLFFPIFRWLTASASIKLLTFCCCYQIDRFSIPLPWTTTPTNHSIVRCARVYFILSSRLLAISNFFKINLPTFITHEAKEYCIRMIEPKSVNTTEKEGTSFTHRSRSKPKWEPKRRRMYSTASEQEKKALKANERP